MWEHRILSPLLRFHAGSGVQAGPVLNEPNIP